ncbi:MAG: phosphopantetheine-binding protein [Solirubrobacteraceae bacterium]
MSFTHSTRGDEQRDREQEILAAILTVIAEVAPNKDIEIRGDCRLVDELEFNSLALLELAFTLEDEFDLTPITEEDARQITTVDKVVEHVLADIRERAADPA